MIISSFRNWQRLRSRGLKFFLLCHFLLLASTAQAQITPDATLGAERSRLVPRAVGGEQIEGGAIRGANLFHSFSDFNVGNGAQVYFANPAGVQNILARVTGNALSNINGTLGIEGSANLFLLNPNGLIFGPNARLDVRGSFVGSTATAIGFGNQGEFSATNPQAPSPLLTIQPSTLLFSQVQGGAIVNQARSSDSTGLSVPTGKSLLLVGGNVVLDGGQITVPGGRIELGGLAESGSVGLTNTSDRWQLTFPTGVQRSDITLQNHGLILNSGGLDDIVLTGRNITVIDTPLLPVLLRGVGTLERHVGNLKANATGNVSFDYSNTQGSPLENADIEDSGSGSITAENIFLKRTSLGGSIPGNSRQGISLNASGSTTLDSSFIVAGINSQTGDAAGNVNITTRNLNLINGSGIFTFGNTTASNTGKVTLQVADTLLLSGRSLIGTGQTTAGEVIGGRSGDIEIQAGRIMLDGVENIISASSRGTRAGDVRIKADTITINGGTINSLSNGAADGGNIDIQTRFLSVLKGGAITTSSNGSGRSGNLTISASEGIEVKGVSDEPIQLRDGESVFLSSFLSTASFGSGNSGQLTINTGRLSVLDSGFVSSTAGNRGAAGDILINATGLVEVAGGTEDQSIISQLASAAQGTGDAGNILINANRLSVRDGALVTTFTTQENSPSRSGDITVKASDSVEIIDRSTLTTDTSSNGDAGTITIQTGFLTLSQSNLRSITFGSGNANGGNINIEAQGVSVLNGGSISAGSLGRGRSGNLTIHASELIDVYGEANDGRVSYISASTLGTGDAGNILISTGRLRVRDGAFISTQASQVNSNAKGGNIIIRAQDGIEVGGRARGGQFISSLDSSTRTTESAGNIAITAPLLFISDGAITSTTLGSGQGGTVQIDVDSLKMSAGAISAFTQGSGNAGNIVITARGAVSLDRIDQDGFNSSISVSAFQDATGRPGSLMLNADSIELADSAQINALTRNMNPGGDITINANRLRATNGAAISSSATSKGRAGNITLNVRDRVILQGENQNQSPSGLFASSTGSGSGGNILINTQQLNVLDKAAITALSVGDGNAGSVTVNASLVRLSNGAAISTRSGSTDGGDVTINATEALVLRRDSRISASAGTEQAPGNGGNILINAGSIVSKSDENNTIQANAQAGRGGNVSITTQSLLGIKPSNTLIPGQSTITATSTLGIPGTISINRPDVQPTQGISELPTNVIDASSQIAQVCARNRDLARAGKFTVSGTGSLPPNPIEPLTGVPPMPLASIDSSPTTTIATVPTSPNVEILEAQGWVRSRDGKVLLVAQSSETTASARPTATCSTATQQ